MGLKDQFDDKSERIAKDARKAKARRARTAPRPSRTSHKVDDPETERAVQEAEDHVDQNYDL
ncbi:hypothetical protein ACIQXD_24435 [Streptomyces uncialis]|uniref:hypothetical protein n=1 Tax=Streptomyces uncialis TaxID=1048205 RepID=UPI0037F3D16A